MNQLLPKWNDLAMMWQSTGVLQWRATQTRESDSSGRNMPDSEVGSPFDGLFSQMQEMSVPVHGKGFAYDMICCTVTQECFVTQAQF